MNFRRRTTGGETPQSPEPAEEKYYPKDIEGQILSIGRLATGELIEHAPAPCTITKHFLREDIEGGSGEDARTQLSIEIGLRRNHELAANEIVDASATLTELTPYLGQSSTDLCVWRKLSLDLITRTVGYETGMYIDDDESDTNIALLLDEPVNGSKTELDIMPTDPDDRFDQAEQEFFAANLDAFARELADNI